MKVTRLRKAGTVTKTVTNRPITAKAQVAPPRGKPLMSEEGVTRALERHFPGSEWVEELEPSSASTPSPPQDGSSENADSEGTRAPITAFIGGSKYDPAALVQWAKTRVDDPTPILVGPGRWAPKAQTAIDADARLIELAAILKLPVFICPPRDDYYPKGKAKDFVSYEMMVEATEIVACGTGTKVKNALAWAIPGPTITAI